MSAKNIMHFFIDQLPHYFLRDSTWSRRQNYGVRRSDYRSRLLLCTEGHHHSLTWHSPYLASLSVGGLWGRRLGGWLR